MLTLTPQEKQARILSIIHAEIADCNNPDAREVPDFTNRGPFVEKVLASVDLPPGNAWCSAYQYYRFLQAGMAEYNAKNIVLKTGLVQAQVNHFQANSLLLSAEQAQASSKAGNSIIKPGYFVFLFFPELGRYAHIELIVKVKESGDFDSIGGNTTTVPYCREGDRVAAHDRNIYDRKGGKWRYCFGQTF